MGPVSVNERLAESLATFDVRTDSFIHTRQIGRYPFEYSFTEFRLFERTFFFSRNTLSTGT